MKLKLKMTSLVTSDELDDKDERHESSVGEEESVVVLDGGIEAEHGEHEDKQAEDDAND